MTDAELAQAAWLELTKTTDSYPKWKSRGFPSGTHWSNAKGLIDQIGAPPPPPPPPSVVLWRATFEVGDFSEWYSPETGPSGNYGGGVYESGVASHAVETVSGLKAGKLTITAPPSAGSRLFRWKELRENRELVCQANVMLPQAVTLTAPASTGQFWLLMQFKSRSVANAVDPIWGIVLRNSPGGLMPWIDNWGQYLGATYRNFQLAGAKPLAVGAWTTFKMQLRQGNNNDGRLRVWQDGVLLFDKDAITTSYNNPAFNTWACSNEWSVNAYSDGTAPSPCSIYVDDASISLPT